VYLPVAPDEMLTYGESKFALKYSNGKAMPSGFNHFYCHRVVLSTQKNLKVFFNISRRLGGSHSAPKLLTATLMQEVFHHTRKVS